MIARRAFLAVLAVLAAGTLAPAVGHAEDSSVTVYTTPDEKSCPEYGGGKPGDQKTLSDGTRSYKVICGRDGKWHQVARTVKGGARGTTAARVTIAGATVRR
jgi:hypothetical protein